MKNVSLVIPVYNESESIVCTIQEILEVFDNQDHFNLELIVLNDGSTDDTSDQLIKHFPNVIIIENILNMGYGYSLKRGIEQAQNDTIIINDGDGSYPVVNLIQLLERYFKGIDLVVGSREKSFVEDSFFKNIFRWTLKFLVEFTAGIKIPDVNSGLRIFSKKTITPYFPYLSNKFSFTTSMTLHFALDAKKIDFIPNGYRKRIGKSKVKIFKDSLRTLQFIVEIIAYKNPLKLHLLAMFPTLFLIFLSLIYWVVFKDYFPIVSFLGVLFLQFSLSTLGLHRYRNI